MHRLLLVPMLFVAASLPPAASAQHEGHAGHAPATGRAQVLGSVAFRNSGAPAAQAALQRGVALLHNFAYADAAAALREAQRTEPGLAVAYWLEALTYSHVLWQEEELPSARAALARLGSTPEARLAKAPTGWERDFGAAVEAYFAAGPRGERAHAYAEALRQAAAADSANLEAGAFAAHATLAEWSFARPDQKPRLAAEAEALARRVFIANPNHPGAAHYLTHIADANPRRAPELTDAARAYARIAADAEHALHMPSHVFLPLGMWDDVAAANERAWAASRQWVAQGGHSNADRSWHTLEWLQYAYLQQGRWSEARALIDSAQALLRGVAVADDNPDARYTVNALAFRYASESGHWNAWPREIPSAAALMQDPQPTARAQGMALWAAYHAAVAAIRARGDTVPAATLAERLVVLADSMISPPQQAVTLGAVARLRAHVALRRGDRAEAVRLLRASATPGFSGASTPPAAEPLFEMVGAILMEAGQPAEAAAAYERALTERPNRSAALLGLARARTAAGDAPGAAEAYARLAANWRRADAEARSLAGGRR
jgi:Tfp pilus assembly protein PilF